MFPAGEVTGQGSSPHWGEVTGGGHWVHANRPGLRAMTRRHTDAEIEAAAQLLEKLLDELDPPASSQSQGGEIATNTVAVTPPAANDQ